MCTVLWGVKTKIDLFSYSSGFFGGNGECEQTAEFPVSTWREVERGGKRRKEINVSPPPFSHDLRKKISLLPSHSILGPSPLDVEEEARP